MSNSKSLRVVIDILSSISDSCLYESGQREDIKSALKEARRAMKAKNRWDFNKSINEVARLILKANTDKAH